MKCNQIKTVQKIIIYSFNKLEIQNNVYKSSGLGTKKKKKYNSFKNKIKRKTKKKTTSLLKIIKNLRKNFMFNRIKIIIQHI